MLLCGCPSWVFGWRFAPRSPPKGRSTSGPVCSARCDHSLLATGAGVSDEAGTPVQAIRVQIGGQDADILHVAAAEGQAPGVLRIDAKIPGGVAPGDAPARNVRRVYAQSRRRDGVGSIGLVSQTRSPRGPSLRHAATGRAGPERGRADAFRRVVSLCRWRRVAERHRDPAGFRENFRALECP